MHDSPPPYPGINPTYPNQPNGTNAPQQPPQMGFAGGPADPPMYTPQAPGGGYPPQAAGGYPGAAAGGYPGAAGGSTYPTLPPNGFNGGFQPSPSAPSEFIQQNFLFKFTKKLHFSDERTRSCRFGVLRSTSPQLSLRPAAAILRKSSLILRIGPQQEEAVR